ncbi:MAG: transcriptional regulator with XRE-family HTH domain [Phenylobacterium sp.]|jgi:transcriptional regulator with XRE-family HTH domain
MTKPTDTSSSQDNQTIGQRILAACEQLNISQTQLARQVGVTPQAVGQWIEGKSKPGTNNLSKVCEALNTTPGYILYGTTDETPSLTAFLQTDEFRLALNTAMHSVLAQGVELNWVDCKDTTFINPMADMVLLQLKKELDK